MMKKEKNYLENVENYFSKNAKAWVDDQYRQNSYSYSVGPNRIRICLDIIKEKFKNKSLEMLDIGCGNANFCIAAAKQGNNILGLDQSKEMISLAKKNISNQNTEISKRIQLMNSNISDIELKGRSFDMITALGLYEYLTDEEEVLSIIYALLKPNGIFIMDCRNRLFNMISISNYTLKEIETGNALRLINEIEQLYSDIPEKNYSEFVKSLNKSIDDAGSFGQKTIKNSNKDSEFVGTVEGTQQTPKEISALAKKHGFVTEDYVGVHPHLFIPKLNKRLPPQVFNQLSDSLLPFERLPISLIWSSKFLIILRKR